MSKMNIEKKLVSRKLVLTHETVRGLSAQTLEEVVGGALGLSIVHCTLACSAACSVPC
jgi:hypothetical protein